MESAEWRSLRGREALDGRPTPNAPLPALNLASAPVICYNRVLCAVLRVEDGALRGGLVEDS